MKYVSSILIFILISGCSATGPVYKSIDVPQDGKSILHIYRPKAFQNSLISPGIVLDGNEVLLLKNGGYTYIPVAEGVHLLNVKLSDDYSGSSELKIHTKSKTKSFVKLTTYNQGIGGNRFERVFYLEEVPNHIAENEISECRYIDPENSGKHRKSIFVDN